MSGILAGIAALAAAVAARAWLGRRWALASSTDELFHRAYIESIRANGHRVPPRHPRVLGPGANSYPALMHVALSFVSPRVLPSIERYLGLAVDLVLAGGTSWLLADRTEVGVGAALGLAGALLLSPGQALIDYGPRAFGLTPRILGEGLFGGALLLLLAAGPGIDPPAAAGIVVIFATMALSSKFSIQVLVLVVPVAALLLWSWVPIALAAAGLALAFVASGGYLGRQLLGQLRHLEWYVHRYVQHVPKRADWRSVGTAIRRGDVAQTARLALIHHPILSGLLRHTHLFVALAWLAADPGFALPLTDLGWLVSGAAAACLAAVAVWVATSHGSFRILGEAERYLGYVLPASWLLFWSRPSPAQLAWLAPLAFAAYAATFSLNLVALARMTERRPPTDRQEMVRVAGERGGVVLTLNVVDALAFVPVTSVCMYNGQESLRGATGEFMEWFLIRYPHVHPGHLREIVDRFGVELVLVRTGENEALRAETGVGYDLSRFERIHANAGYELYATGRRGAAGPIR